MTTTPQFIARAQELSARFRDDEISEAEYNALANGLSAEFRNTRRDNDVRLARLALQERAATEGLPLSDADIDSLPAEDVLQYAFAGPSKLAGFGGGSRDGEFLKDGANSDRERSALLRQLDAVEDTGTTNMDGGS